MYSPWLRKAFTRTAQGHHNESSNWNLKQPHYDRRTGRIQLYLQLRCAWLGLLDRNGVVEPTEAKKKIYKQSKTGGKTCETVFHYRFDGTTMSRATNETLRKEMTSSQTAEQQHGRR